MFTEPQNNNNQLTDAFFTVREREIIDQLMKGKLNKEIAGDLKISINTVKKHTKNIYKKARVRNRIEAVQCMLNVLRA